MKAMKLIMNADDFGYTKGVCDGIVDAHRHGIVRSTTAMCNLPDLMYAATLSQANPMLGVGIHLTLTVGKPLTNGSSLVDAQGMFHKQDQLLSASPLEAEVYQEFVAQMERFIEVFGRKPTHIDSHHLIHEHPTILAVVLQLAKQYERPVRGHGKYLFSKAFYETQATTEYLLALLRQYQEYWNQGHPMFDGMRGVELMCHPARCDEELASKSSYVQQREQELMTLCDPQIASLVQELGIVVGSYVEEVYG